MRYVPVQCVLWQHFMVPPWMMTTSWASVLLLGGFWQVFCFLCRNFASNSRCRMQNQMRTLESRFHIDVCIYCVCVCVCVCSHGGLSSHHRGGVRDQDHGGPRSEGEAADLGHGRSGALQGRHQVLLQRGRWGPHGVWHHQVLAGRGRGLEVMSCGWLLVCVGTRLLKLPVHVIKTGSWSSWDLI